MSISAAHKAREKCLMLDIIMVFNFSFANLITLKRRRGPLKSPTPYPPWDLPPMYKTIQLFPLTTQQLLIIWSRHPKKSPDKLIFHNLE